MTELFKQVIDASTGESTIVPFSKEDIEAHKVIQAQVAHREAAQEAEIAARESALAKLAALGLTEEEIAAL